MRASKKEQYYAKWKPDVPRSMPFGAYWWFLRRLIPVPNPPQQLARRCPPPEECSMPFRRGPCPDLNFVPIAECRRN